MNGLTTLLAVCVLVAAPVGAAGQSLAELARKEEARRQASPQAQKTYKNEDLRQVAPPPGMTEVAPRPASSDAPAPATDTPATAAPAAAAPATSAPASPAPAPKDQKYWATRIGEARSALERSRIFADALQSRLNALATDIVNRDDPAQRSQLELERQRSLGELDRVRLEIAAQTKAIADIEEEARRAGVPPGWLR